MSNGHGTKVRKRNGSVEPLNLEKIHKVTAEACDGLGSAVSASQVEMNSGIQFYDGISTEEIQEILVRSASDLISLEAPNYQFVAARLLLYGLKKQVFGVGWVKGHPPVHAHAVECISKCVYDGDILDKYSAEEWDQIDAMVDHDRDYLFTYAGLRQVADKYLVQDRSSGEVYETPQYMYIMIAVTLFQNYPKETRLDYVRRYYDAISRHKINIPTPIMAGVRTPLRQFASCVLVDVDDTLDSIFSSDMAIGKYVAQRLASASTQAESVASTVRSEAEKFNTQVLYRSSKSLKQLSDVALKMALEVDQQLSTSPSGTKKSKTS